MISFALILIAITFLVILWFNRKIWEKYHNTKKTMSAKTQAMQKQLSIVLIAQVKTILLKTVMGERKVTLIIGRQVGSPLP